MTCWPKVRLETLASFKNGLNFPGTSWGKGLKIIGVSDFGDRSFPDYGGLDEVNPHGIVREVDLLAENDILFVRSNGNRELIGRSLLIKGLREPLSHSGFTIRLRFKKDAPVCARFYAYLFKSDLIRKTLSGSGGGTNINNLNQALLSQLDVPVPPVVEQERIAGLLACYDELIANNQYRIVLLESIAEEIYREWFVRMRFPGSTAAAMMVGYPRDWEPVRVEKMAKRLPFGRIFHESETQPSGEVEVIDQSRKSRLGFHDGDPQHMATEDKPIVLFGDHSCKMRLMTTPFSLAENVIPFEPNNGRSALLLYHLIKDLMKTTEYKRHWTELINKEVLLPSRDLEASFEGLVWPLHKQCQCLGLQTEHLERTRDTLLPRLISGRLRVDQLEIQYPARMKAELAKAD